MTISSECEAYTKAVAGTSKNKSLEYSFSRNQLDDKDWNTTLQGIYVTDLEFDKENDGYSVDVYTNMEGYINDDESLVGWEDVSVGGWSSGLLDSSSVSSEVRNRNYSSGYYLGGQQSLFTTSSDAYYYSVRLDISNQAYSSNQVRWARYVIGTYTDIINGTAQIGGWVNGTNTVNKNIMNDFRSEPIYLAVLVSYYTSLSDRTVDGEKNEYNQYASVSFSADIDVTYTPYYLDEGTGDITAELDEQTDELKDVNTELNSQTTQMKEQTTTQKSMLSKMTNFFGSFFDNLKNAVIGLFVPSEEEMKGLFDRLMDFFNDTFGFLFYPFDFIIRLVDLFIDSENMSTTVTFPGFSIMGMQVWDTMEFDITEYDVTVQVFGLVRLVTGAIISFGFINYLRKFFDKRFGGGGN